MSLSAAGVYFIECTPVRRFYIGSTTNSFRRRFAQHKHALRAGRAGSSKLQRAWDKYGESVFIFSPLLECPSEDARKWEQLAIDILEPEYNILKTAGGEFRGLTLSDEQRARAADRAKMAWAAGCFARNGKTERNFYLVQGESLSVAGICAKYGLSKQTVRSRLQDGWRHDDLGLPKWGRKPRYDVGGESLTSADIAKIVGISQEAVLYRVRSGVRGAELLRPPHQGKAV